MISPLKYHIEASTWSIVKRTATLYNRTNQTLTIYTWKANFESKDSTWKPYFSTNNELTWYELSDRINIDSKNFEISPNSEKKIEFSIIIPDDATPGWHYWAVFFKHRNSNIPNKSDISMNVDYWILLLVNIEWEVIKSALVWDLIIQNFSKLIVKIKDKCFLDLSWNDYDDKCIDFSIDNLKANIFEINVDKNFDDENIIDQDKNFKVTFDIQIDNIWNTHIKPKWKIILLDEDWNQIKWIWKENNFKR